ncbi:DUF4352 domain-containing protein [Sporosarcina aquimarina]|uniref:DUF4352 domain-containing protein n=1 Tax=Sporosarcina aquimarina TaxID=114975 RepID=UPI00203FA338|nr:DUF4352 domain-containing protein [Sporosarcina aquimarina]MCM3757362.1 DUF4352 domain-containing protein [Sporosarcina aquimarina]
MVGFGSSNNRIAVSTGREDEATTADTTPLKEQPAKAETPKKAKPEKKEAKVTGVGEVVKVGKVEFTVNSTSTAKNVGGEYGQNAQGTYLLVNVTVKNTGNESITADTSFFQIKAGDKTYDADSTASIYANEATDFFRQQVNPDLSATGVVVFDVSDELIANPELMLQVQTGFFGTETGLIKIGQ